MAKTLLELLNKYIPSDNEAAILNSGVVSRSRVDKEKRCLEVYADFDKIVPKNQLYAIEENVKKAYDLQLCRLRPQYPSEAFCTEYIKEILLETEREGLVARGFFNDYDYSVEDGAIIIRIPFSEHGIDLLCAAKTPAVIEGIIKREFGLNYSVKIEQDGCDVVTMSKDYIQRLEAIDKQIYYASERYGKNQGAGYEAERSTAQQEEEKLPRIASIYGDNAVIERQDNGILKIGSSVFDISEPQYVIGIPFEISPVLISSVTRAVKNIVFIGEVFNYTEEEARNKEKLNVSFGIFDGNASIFVKRYSIDVDDAKELKKAISNGMSVAVRGYTKGERYDESELFMNYSDIAVISKKSRVDSAENKRVELHLHTTMSTMDALIPPDVAVKTAHKWGHKAVAITDHGNVQGFPEAMIAAEKLGMKVIYGIEAYFVNNAARVIYGNYDGGFDDELIVFDLETTGLFAASCKITEIGAVKIKNGEVLETFNSLVNPECPIPEDVVEVTGITDEMVADAETIDKVLPRFLEFIGDRLLIAHNADFDISFVRVAAKNLGLDFKNPYLDTLGLSRAMLPELKKYKLDRLAAHYKLGDFNHHRASDDATMLAMIFFKMAEQLQASDVKNFKDVEAEFNGSADPLKLKPYHQIILVKNKTGLKNLYRLISDSYLKFYRKAPRIPRTELEKYREGLIIGSACEAGELFTALLEGKTDQEIEDIVSFYDYLEIQPISNNRFLIDKGSVRDEEGLRELNRKIVELGEKYEKPVIAACDAHYLNDEDEIYRKILVDIKYGDNEGDSHLYFRTTEEMLAEFEYLGKKKAFEIVVENTNKIADMIEDVRPIPKGTFTPNMEGAEEDLQALCWTKARSMYGEKLPEIVEARLNKELTSIIKNGFAVLYMIAQKLVWYSESQGYLVGSRGSVGSSFVATMAGISEVNPLPPHYYCKKCQYSQFFTDGSVGSGFDLPDAFCPNCKEKLMADGHDIPFETFLGFYGDKSPDIDLNFSGDVQGRVHKYTEDLFGAENVFRAGTLGTLADKTAFGYVSKFFEERGQRLPRAEMQRLVEHCMGVKKTTGQHPGGIIVVPREYDVYDFTPVQRPADDPNSDITTTHFAFSYLHDTILKLDELGHDIPTKYKWLETFSNTSVMDVPMNAQEVYELFHSTKPLGISPSDIDSEIGTFGLPEFGTRFLQQVLVDAKPKNFADLLQISGLTHGTGVWLGNADELIKNGTCDISKVIGCRDNIMNDLIRYGLENSLAFKIMESVRKGKGLTPEWEEEMRKNNVPEWYIGSCKKIKYMFPKAHAAAYVMSAIRLGWYKVNMPIAFYGAMFTVAPGGFDAGIIGKGRGNVVSTIKEIEKMGKKEASPKELASIPSLQLANECMARGFKFLPVDIEKSHSYVFQPENGNLRMPFSALAGLGENAAANIVAAREEEPFFSVEDLQTRAKLSKSVIEILRVNGALDNLDETDQLTMF